MQFVGMKPDEYKDTAARHILNNHRDEAPDNVIVKPVGGIQEI